VPIYVGESYCEEIQAPTNIYVDTDFEVVCTLDTNASSTPNSYEILVNDVAIKTGTITGTPSEIRETISLSAGTNKVECLIT